MVNLQPAHLRARAQTLLQGAAFNPKTLVLIHTGISLGASLLISILNYILSLGIAETGGLGGLGLRSVLTSAQAILELVVYVVLPFWNIGLLFAALNWAKGENATPVCLLQGFRRFPTVLALFLLQGCIYLVLGMGIFNVSTFLFLMTPFSTPLMEQLQPMLDGASSSGLPEMTPELMAAAEKHTAALLVIFAVLFLIVALPLSYRLRFAQYGVMEGQGAMSAIVHSIRITKKNTLQLFKLDLSYWWFYLLQALTVVLCYGDAILPALGISLPFSSETAYFLFYVLGIVAQCILLWQYQASLSTAYCLAYRKLDPQPEKTN